MKIAVVVKKSADVMSKAEDFLSKLKEYGDFEFAPYDASSRDADRLLVFGGDGTALEAASVAGKLPILAVNFGHLGFLSEFDATNADYAAVAQALRIAPIREYMLLDAIVGEDPVGSALNDVVIKSSGTRPINAEIYIDGKFADGVKGDGVLVCTPVGSTAYSLSAGGPVLDPALKAFVVNPICPHSLHSRPIVTGANSVVTICVGGAATISLDGSFVTQLTSGRVSVKKSKNTADFITASGDNFYKKLTEKMNGWGVSDLSS